MRVDGECSPLLVRVGECRPLLLPVDAGWALWRCLSEAVASTGEPPDWIRVNVAPTRK